MNIVLFEPDQWRQPLAPTDHRALHLLEILRLSPGDRFAFGEVGGACGTLRYRGLEAGALVFDEVLWAEGAPPPPAAVEVLVGTPRPPTARRLLKDLTTLGAAGLHFAATDLGDKAYLMSTLWRDGEFRDALLEGAAQTRTTWLPQVNRYSSLVEALRALEAEGPVARVWFDEGGIPWDRAPIHDRAGTGTLVVALGPERGWSAAERDLLARRGWERASLGPRTLRTETASALALGIAVLRGWT